MRYPKLRELLEAVKALIQGPYTSRFPAEPSPTPPGFRGRPTYHDDECIGCGACYEVCPARAITLQDDTAARPPCRTLVVRYDHCIFCQMCQRSCPTEKGIMLENEYNMVSNSRDDQRMQVSKELVVCDVCGSVIAAREQLRWLYRKLGPLAQANATLMLVSFRELGVVPGPEAETVRRQPGDVSRGDRMRLLCPVCRAHVSLIV